MEEKNLLLIIDPQNDFVDTEGTMYIPGAEQAIKNLCRWISINKKNIDSIIVTQDTHRSYHIGHSVFWKEMPPEFTNITSEDVEKGTYSPVNESKKEEVIEYLKGLEKRGLKHTIWPEHCISGSWGQVFPKDLVEMLNIWSLGNNGKNYLVWKKGEKPSKEMYSAFTYADRSEIDYYKTRGGRLLSYISSGFDNIYVAGFAKDYCVAESVKDLMEFNCEEDKPNFIFLEDCMAAIDKNSKNMKIYEDAIKSGKGKIEKTV